MRIISQDGKFDLPYESCVIWIDNKAGINVSPIGEPDSNYTFGVYSTPKKAEKAMKLLHEAYSGMPIIFQNIEISDEEIPKIESMLKNVICVKIPDEPSKVEYINNVIFRFPKEEDL